MSRQQTKDALQKYGALTAEQIGARADLCMSTVSLHLKSLREKKEVHITAWIPLPPGKPGRNRPVYALGNVPDAVDLPRGRRARAKQVTTSRVALKCAARIDAGMWSGLMA